jgi:hypothetical protein
MAHAIMLFYSTKSSWGKEKATNFQESSFIPKFGRKKILSLSILITIWWWKGEAMVIIHCAFVKMTIVLFVMEVCGIDKRFLARLNTYKTLWILKFDYMKFVWG